MTQQRLNPLPAQTLAHGTTSDTQTLTHGTTSDSMDDRRVPTDLIPMNAKDTSYDWGHRTYLYCHLFDANVKRTYYQNADEVLSWCRCANRIQMDLKRQGILTATAWIVHLCKVEFKLKNTANQAPASLNDVMTIITDPIWYNKDLHHSRFVVYMLSYGIFRVGYNGWAHAAVTAWMHTYNIAYHGPHMNSLSVSSGVTGHDTRVGKGFVYRLLIARASNTICNRFQEATKRTFNEYICVRGRSLGPSHNRQDIRFLHFKAFLVTVPSITSTTVKERFRAAVTDASRDQLSQACMVTIINDICASDTRSTIHQQGSPALTGASLSTLGTDTGITQVSMDSAHHSYMGSLSTGTTSYNTPAYVAGSGGTPRYDDSGQSSSIREPYHISGAMGTDVEPRGGAMGSVRLVMEGGLVNNRGEDLLDIPTHANINGAMRTDEGQPGGAMSSGRLVMESRSIKNRGTDMSGIPTPSNVNELDTDDSSRDSLDYNQSFLMTDSTDIPMKRAIMNNSTPLFVCANAMNVDHTCVHVKCSACYTHPKTRTKRKRSSHTTRCDHKVLDPFDNDSYYKTAYLEQMSDVMNFPKQCVGRCQGTIYATSSV